MTEPVRTDQLEDQVTALANALAALIRGGVADTHAFAGTPGHLNGAGKARELLEAAGLWPVGDRSAS